MYVHELTDAQLVALIEDETTCQSILNQANRELDNRLQWDRFIITDDER